MQHLLHPHPFYPSSVPETSYSERETVLLCGMFTFKGLSLPPCLPDIDVEC